ncbi:hypothetical protein ACX3YG_19540 [Pseudomonas wadenswilerensis]
MSIINGHGWQNIAVSQHRTLAAIPGADAQAYQSETATASAVSTVASASASRSTSDSTYQDAKDAQDEAFAKLKVVLQNSGSTESGDTASLSESDSTVKTTSAAQEFRDYMALSPEEKIRLKMLNELGLTEEDYEALPPEKKDAIDKQIAQRMKDESEMKSMAAVEPQMQAAVAATQALVKPVSEVDAADPAQVRKDKEDREDPFKV